jgi:hypothetical protein
MDRAPLLSATISINVPELMVKDLNHLVLNNDFSK